ncbi:uncharacterized protein LOC135200261 isoform X2 [Macrobrachium nipponense]|uniref:uncharacterized protein LOC135200261 isoform X2 n=1 Tax=Macrobrachium nipponense TaxID=159736 RepID=UPI0030C84E28
MEAFGSASAKDCGVCRREFDEGERCPRILECFHTVCTSCAKGFINGRALRCPFCREAFEVDHVSDIRINEDVLDLTRYIRFLMRSVPPPPPSVDETDSQSFRGSPSVSSMPSVRDGTIQNLSGCRQAQERAESSVRKYVEMQESVLTSHKTFEEKVKTILCDINEKTGKRAREMTTAIEELQSRVNEASERHRVLGSVKEKLDSLPGVSEDTLPSLYQAQKTNVAVQEWLTNFKTFIKNKEIVWLEEKEVFQRKAVTMKMIIDLLESCRAPERSDSVAARLLERASLLKLTPENLVLKPNDCVRCLVDKGKVYVVHLDQDSGRGRRSSKIYVSKDNKLCFSCMKEERVPYSAHVFETFLELGTEACPSLGRLYIRFYSDSPLARQFSLLCSGVLGPAYLNSKFLNVFRKGCNWAWVRCGDYENNDGSGGRELVSGLGVSGGKQSVRPCSAGTLEGWLGCGKEVASQFIIYLKDNNKMVSDECSGFVEEGFNVLEEAVSRSNIGDVRVVDCGIVLNSSFS